MPDCIEVDGTLGGGRGEVLRCAMSASLVSGRAVRLYNLRSGEESPGLRDPDVALLGAAAAIAPGSRLRGDVVGSTEVEFSPAPCRPGRFNLVTTPAGSVGSLVQMICLPLALAGGRSQLRITGGTHIAGRPSWEFLDQVWAVWMRRCGVEIDMSLEREGFFPRGGGLIRVGVQPSPDVIPLNLPPNADQGPDRIRIISLQTDDLPRNTGRRGTNTFVSKLRERPNLVGPLTDVQRTEGRIQFRGSTGAHVFAVVDGPLGPAGFQFLALRDRPEDPGSFVAQRVLSYLGCGAVLDMHTAEQLMLPLAVASGPSRISAPCATPHMVLKKAIIELFGLAHVRVVQGEPAVIEIEPS